MKNNFTVKEIVESALLIALAVIFDIQGLKIQIGSGGGSISFTMVPLMILALRMNPLKSLISIGIIYGLITCLIDGWGIQYFGFDYLLAYGSISLLSFFRKIILNKDNQTEGIFCLVLSIILCLISRFVFHTLSSMILFDYSLMPAIAYNAPYVFISGVASLTLMLLLYKPLLIINQKFPPKSIWLMLYLFVNF